MKITLSVIMVGFFLTVASAQDCPTYQSQRFYCTGENGCHSWQVASYCGPPNTQYYQCYDCAGYGLCCDQEYCTATWIGECGEGQRPGRLSRLYVPNCKGGFSVKFSRTDVGGSGDEKGPAS
jgi:hypothetical protein